ncbi:lysosome membrane protein 2-like protein [Leptotrombidium deliense]|uniref:Lysosome membrane protein 2-like protein n=1 Tax=Leptotrombidium deliense TaxID=299467 RepID=A0A443SJW6_9ACAR|nr:lysosome membrane protein 2-like protein [Leptotrombidium deliense]
MTFVLRRTYFYEPDLNTISLNENVTILNLPVVGITAVAMESVMNSWLKRNMVNTALNSAIDSYDEHPFLTLTVGQLLFDGKNIQFMSHIDSLLKTFSIEIKDMPPGGNFSLFAVKNGTFEGKYTAKTGTKKLNEIGQVIKWNGESKLNCWEGDKCNEIKGTEGLMFHPFLSRNETLLAFGPELSRSLALKYDKDNSIHGIPTYRYIISNDFTEAPRYSNITDCFCYFESDPIDLCKYTALFDMRRCLSGAPLVLSLPHFYMSNESLIKSVNGMSPSTDKHETFLNLDPLTGFTLSARKALQMNVFIKQSYGITILDKLPTGFYPLLWMQEGATVPKHMVQELKSMLHDKIDLFEKVLYSLLFLGIIFVLISLIMLYITIKRTIIDLLIIQFDLIRAKSDEFDKITSIKRTFIRI